VRLGDFSRSETLDHAFAEIETLLLISTDAVGVRLEQQRAAIAAAVRAGVGRILYTSVPNPVASNPAFVVPDHADTEAALRESGMHWIALRNNLYAHMQLPSIQRAAASGRFVTNQGEGRAAYVTREDCAAVAVAAMLQSGHDSRAYDVTGPAALGAADLAALSGDRVEVVPVTDEEYVSGLVAANLSESLARGLASFGTGIREGYFATVTNVVQDLTGHPATSLTTLLA
jgi:NAD(P)H dehydrogenase (quinone)